MQAGGGPTGTAGERKLGRIAILGNMNNIGFALLRYFRDLGEDAHLLLYANDGTDSLSHFRPEADSWEVERWRPFIRQTRVLNWTQSLVINPRERALPLAKSLIRSELAGFDTYLACGLAPAIFHRVGMHLDAFFPYSTGVEFLGSAEILDAARRVWINRLSLHHVQRMQREGIARTSVVFNAEMGPTAQTLSEIDVRVEPLALPLVYVGEEPSPDFAERRALEITGGRSAPFRIFCSSRVMFKNKSGMTPELWVQENKNSDYLFHALKILLDRPEGRDSLLYLPEYGPDVAEAKALCDSLGLSDRVVWLPTLERRDLRCMLKWCHAAVGQFYEKDGIIWGSTGWEALAAGIPFIQRVNFTAEGYRSVFGQPLPPIVHASRPEEIAEALQALAKRPDERSRIGDAGREWFRLHNGHVLAGRWLDALAASKHVPQGAAAGSEGHNAVPANHKILK